MHLRSLAFFAPICCVLLAMSLISASPSLAATPNLVKPLAKPYAAPPITGIEQWLNSEPLSLEGLKGKVVLIDFWTYSCVNCIRTLPYLTAWDAKYRDKGLVIIGISAPEFEFEKDLKNVRTAMEKYGIRYPVALDNAFTTWKLYNNRYWPAHYLINRDGKVVHTHFGEGEYDAMEHNIRALLGLDAAAEKTAPTATALASGQTPETYLGLARRKSFAGDVAENALALNQWSLRGGWKSAAQNITSSNAGDALSLHFNARTVHLVLGTASGKPARAAITLNGVSQPSINVGAHQLYTLVQQPAARTGTLTLTADAPGLEAYAFTFGN